MEGKLPVSLVEGIYRVAIWMPDAQSSLVHHPTYDIKWVENQGVKHMYNEKAVLNIVGLLKW